jgi:hypothetical protein
MRGLEEIDRGDVVPETSLRRLALKASPPLDSLPAPDLAEGPHCPVCGGGPLIVSGVSQLHFSCPQAHVYFLSDLLAAHSEEVMADLRRLLASWSEKGVLLGQVACDARTYGYETVAATFERRARTLEQRVELLRQGLGQVAP